MQENHIKSLENISAFCYFCGIIPIFLGILVVFMDILQGAMDHMLVGLFVFISGYANVKISMRISDILDAEKKIMGIPDARQDQENKICIGEKEFVAEDFKSSEKS